MPAYKILQQEIQEDIQEDISKLELELEKELAECTEVRQTCRNKVKAFMIEQKIWHISELDYPLRKAFHRFLKVRSRERADGYLLSDIARKRDTGRKL